MPQPHKNKQQYHVIHIVTYPKAGTFFVFLVWPVIKKNLNLYLFQIQSTL